MSFRDDGVTVLLADEREAPVLAAEVSAAGSPAAWYPGVAELLRQRPLSSVSVLVVVSRPLPKGILLAMLGRMSVEYPAMQKVVVVDGPPPLPVVEYLTACGVDVLWANAEGVGEEAGRLASTLRRIHERTRWVAA